MTQTLIGFFNDVQLATAAFKHMLDCGYAEENMELHEVESKPEPRVDERTVSGSETEMSNEGPLGHLGSLAKKLLGETSGADEAFNTATRRAGVLLLVDINDPAQLSEVRGLLAEEGAIHVQESLSESRNPGYRA
jgi:hypothetical protein